MSYIRYTGFVWWVYGSIKYTGFICDLSVWSNMCAIVRALMPIQVASCPYRSRSILFVFSLSCSMPFIACLQHFYEIRVLSIVPYFAFCVYVPVVAVVTAFLVSLTVSGWFLADLFHEYCCSFSYHGTKNWFVELDSCRSHISRCALLFPVAVGILALRSVEHL